MTQIEKANRFRDLHRRDGIFLIPNPWDAGSARMLEQLGFEALATSSAAFAATLGRRDGKVTRDEKLAHVRQIVQARKSAVSLSPSRNRRPAQPTSETKTRIRIEMIVSLLKESFKGLIAWLPAPLSFVSIRSFSPFLKCKQLNPSSVKEFSAKGEPHHVFAFAENAITCNPQAAAHPYADLS